MSLFKKIFRLARTSEEDTFLSSVDASVEPLKKQLDQLTSATADAMSHHNRLDSECQKFLRRGDQWKQRAKESLAAGDEPAARQALLRKTACEQDAASLQPNVEKSRTQSEHLARQTGLLRQEIADAERNARTLVARKHAAKAQERLSDAMAGLDPRDGAFGAIAKYEETVLEHEARAKVLDGWTSDTESTDTSRAADAKVDLELEALKKELS